MRDNVIRSILNRLNKGTHKDIIFTKPLSQEVDYGHAWLKYPSPEDSVVGHGEIPYRFYFIKNRSCKYIGAVLDMNHDLHWYVLPAFRMQGHIFHAMQNTILKDLARDRSYQIITINRSSLSEKNFNSSSALAYKLGFIIDK
jgi:hypothetical protein